MAARAHPLDGARRHRADRTDVREAMGRSRGEATISISSSVWRNGATAGSCRSRAGSATGVSASPPDGSVSPCEPSTRASPNRGIQSPHAASVNHCAPVRWSLWTWHCARRPRCFARANTCGSSSPDAGCRRAIPLTSQFPVAYPHSPRGRAILHCGPDRGGHLPVPVIPV